jgi:hypothetical protein
MFTTKQYRDKAAEYAERGKTAHGPKETSEFAKLEKSFTTLANNEQWLFDNHHRTVRRNVVDAPGAPALAQQEEHVLRCLGAAVIVEWNGLPPSVRRQLYDCASSMGDALDIASLRDSIARFLDKHQDAQS